MGRYKRGEIWQVDFDPQIGSEISKLRPAILFSVDAFNNLSEHHGLLIVTPGTSTRRENPRTGKVLKGVLEVTPSSLNGLKNTTYFLVSQVKSVSKVRLKERVGVLESHFRRLLSQELADILGLFEDLGDY
ncbi:MAG: type II toxin-antitoxin system PemK/MazF family toxin [Cyanobacteriota/Melainabacteria group bacterium]